MSSLERQAFRLHSVKAHVCKEVCLLDQSLSLPAGSGSGSRGCGDCGRCGCGDGGGGGGEVLLWFVIVVLHLLQLLLLLLWWSMGALAAAVGAVAC